MRKLLIIITLLALTCAIHPTTHADPQSGVQGCHYTVSICQRDYEGNVVQCEELEGTGICGQHTLESPCGMLGSWGCEFNDPLRVHLIEDVP